jgi:hypothetical protein
MDISIYAGIADAIVTVIPSANTFYKYFSDEFDFKNNLGCTFEIVNDENINSFDKKEFLKNYNLRILMRYKTVASLLEKSELLKSAIYALPVLNVDLINETIDYDDVLRAYELYLEFDLKV